MELPRYWRQSLSRNIFWNVQVPSFVRSWHFVLQIPCYQAIKQQISRRHWQVGFSAQQVCSLAETHIIVIVLLSSRFSIEAKVWLSTTICCCRCVIRGEIFHGCNSQVILQPFLSHLARSKHYPWKFINLKYWRRRKLRKLSKQSISKWRTKRPSGLL